MKLPRFFTRNYPNPDDVRMTLGEHLEELRSRLIRIIVAIFIAMVVAFIFIDKILGFLVWQVYAILRIQGYEPAMTYLNPTEPFVLDLKVSMIVGAIIAAPYCLAQLWAFVAAGLYPHERKWVHRFAPASVILFFAGGIFFIVVVFPAMLDFLISYRQGVPDLNMPGWLTGGGPEALPSPGSSAWPTTQPFPSFAEDPADAPQGKPWVNLTEHELRVRFGQKTYRLSHFEEVAQRNRLVPELRYSEFIVLELQMAAAFGIGFQVPVVIAFLAVVGIFSAAEMASVRRYVYFVMSIGAAVITPSPDVVSMLLLLVPMVVLFEGGLIVARFIERDRQTTPQT